MKKSTCITLGIAAAAISVPLFLLAPGSATKRQKAPFSGRNFAHRGLHTRDRSVPENSLEAFSRAAEAGYGVELDVQLSRDGHVVVFHDDTLDRVCGVHARVDDLDYSELKSLSLCGSGYGIPLFSDVLSVMNGRAPIICELKTGRRNRELCRKTYEFLSSYEGEVCIESFDPTIVAWFRFHAPDLLRGQLAMPVIEYAKAKPPVSAFRAFMLGNTLFNFIARPQFIAYKLGPVPLSVRIAHILGALKVAWTSHEPRNEKGKDAVIFEFYKPRLRFK